MSLRGLINQKPGRDPQVGQVKLFTIEQRISAKGNPWNKIKNSTQEDGGQPYKILKVEPTGNEDRHGNIGFNLEIEPTDEQLAQTAAPAPQSANHAPRGSVGMTKDDYWERKEDRDRERDARDVAKQPRIERQHAQEMALRLATLDNRVVMDDEGKFSTKKLCNLISWFQRDVSRPCETEPAESKPEPF